MVKQKKMSIVLTTLSCMLVFAGCSSKTVTPQESASAPQATVAPSSPNKDSKTSAPVTLKIVLPGTQPNNYDEVKAAVEKKLAADGQNTKLDIVYVDWGDLDTKTKVMLSSGENIDLIFDAPWLHMNQMISNGYYEDMGELLKTYGPNVTKTRSQQMWDANKFNGKIMGVPLGLYLTQGHSVNIRGDLREQLGLSSLKTYDDLKKYLYAVKDKYPNLSPYLPGAFAIEYTWVNWQLRDDTSVNIRPTQALVGSLMLYFKGNDGKVYNLFDQTDPKIWESIKDANKLYNDKIISPDTLTTKLNAIQVLQQNKGAAGPVALFGPFTTPSELQKTIPGGKVEAVRFFDTTPGKNISNFSMDNFITIPKVSKNKERAMMFLDWANQKDNYMLVEHGIEGKHWQAVGDTKFKQLIPGADETSGGLASFSMVWNPVLERTIDTTDDETMKYNDFVKNADNFTKDVLTGFTFDATPVKNELAQYTSVQTKYYAGIFNGIFDPDKYFAQFKNEGAAPLKKIQAELQKQIDAFLKK